MNLDEDEITFVEPVYAPWDGRRVPVTLLGGYLGAGKTTIINEMLARTDVPIAVMVNDVGDINVDARLIERQGADTLDLTGGCVCCSLKNGFLEAFGQLRQRAEPPEHVVVELSGIADPRPARSLVETPGFVHDSTVVLVDADGFDDLVAETSVVADAVWAQIRAADVIVLSKQDLVPAETSRRVTNRVAEAVPGVPIVAAESAHAAAGFVGLGARRPIEDIGRGASLFDQHRTRVIPIPGTTTRAQLDRLLDELPTSVMRAKGIVQIETGELLLVHVVGRRRSIEPLPMAESTEPTDLIVIEL